MPDGTTARERWKTVRTLVLLVAVCACRGRPSRAPAAEAGPAVDATAERPAAEATAEAPAPAVPSGPALSLERIAVIGASVSGGFAAPTIAAVLETAVRVPHEIGDFANLMQFRDPYGSGQRQVRRALGFEPTVVFAVDFLFWYAYGGGMTSAGREESLEVGLRELERFEVPLIVGDLPDVRGAAEWMLSPEQIPPAGDLAALNARLREWAAQRPGVLLLPLDRWLAPLREATPVVVEEGEPPVAPTGLMNPDRLHPNEAGLRYLLRRIDEAISRRFPGTPGEAIVVEAGPAVDAGGG